MAGPGSKERRCRSSLYANDTIQKHKYTSYNIDCRGGLAKYYFKHFLLAFLIQRVGEESLL